MIDRLKKYDLDHVGIIDNFEQKEVLKYMKAAMLCLRRSSRCFKGISMGVPRSQIPTQVRTISYFSLQQQKWISNTVGKCLFSMGKHVFCLKGSSRSGVVPFDSFLKGNSKGVTV